MQKKFSMIVALCFLQPAQSLGTLMDDTRFISVDQIRPVPKPSVSYSKMPGYVEMIGTDTCLSIDKISHTPAKHWQVNDPNWVVINDKPDSISLLLQDTVVKQTIRAYNALFFSSPLHPVADVLCNYNNDTIILKRTYTTHQCSWIEGKNDDGSSGVGIFSRYDTHCTTTAGALNVCQYNRIR